jgi:hypothetical protein
VKSEVSAEIVVRREDDQQPRLGEPGIASLILSFEVGFPVLPVEKALVGERRTVPGGVMRADDGAGTAGGSVAGEVLPVDPSPAAGSLSTLSVR